MSQPSPRSPSLQHPVDRWGPRMLTALTAAMVLARLWLVFQRLYDPDELEHLHAGFCVWQGMVPYRDFFEQHGPVLWYLSIPLFTIWGASLQVLFAGRFIIWLLGAATIGLTWHLGNKLYGRWAGPIAALMLVLLPPFQEKTIEWRPDNVAVPLVLLAVLWMGRSHTPRGWLWAGLAGAALCGGFFCTQKIAYVGFGMVAGYALSLVVDAWWSCLAAMLVGACIVAGSFLVFFASQGALDPYIRMTVLLPLEWRTQEPMARYLFISLSSAPVLWGAFAAGAVQSLVDAGAAAARRAGSLAVLGGALAHFAGLWFVPAAFHQYYLPLSPLSALLGARALASFSNLGSGGVVPECSARGLRFVSLLVGLVVTVAALILGSGWTFVPPLWMMILCATLAFSAVAYFVAARRLGLLSLLGAVAIAAWPFLLNQFQWRHAEQSRRMEQLLRATGPDDRCFDGFSGFGALRPHSFFYFWINDHSWPMMSDAERNSGVLDALADPRTRIVLLDQYVRRLLPATARRYIEENFERDEALSDSTVAVFVRRVQEGGVP